MFGVAISAPVIAGAVTAKRIKRIDITNMAVPAMFPIIFKVVNPLEAIHKKNRKIAKQINETSMEPIVDTNVPFPLNNQLNDTKIPWGFCAK